MAIVPIMTSAPSTTAPMSSDTTEVTAAMQNVTMTTTTPERPVRGTNVKLSVPIDGSATVTSTPTRKLVRRDSLDRREALLKGKEGSRQRRRWENDRLLSNPWAEPPLPSDWEVRPTYPIRTVPYYLAPLWDAAEFQRAIESKLKGRKNSTRARKRGSPSVSPMEEAASNVPKEIRAKLKHARSAKGLLQDLEEIVRRFVLDWNEREASPRSGEDEKHEMAITSDNEEDEEIVFIGRNGTMSDESPGKRQSREQMEDWEADTILSREKLVFEGLDGDRGASFARWLVHCVGSYYGLRTWSVTTEREIEGQGGQKERRREAYVGVDRRARGFMGKRVETGREIELPRPLWGMV